MNDLSPQAGPDPARTLGAATDATSRLSLFADRQLPTVLLIWAACWLAFGIFLYQYSVSVPVFDEWELTSVASGKDPLTWQWAWHPQNEHRTPLTRLEVVWLGWAAKWDLRLARWVHLSLLALGGLCLILAARSIRGRSALSDAFLGLLVLTPMLYTSILIYAYAYGFALASLCLAISAAAAGWPLRSLTRLWLYFALVLAVTYSGGPAGNFWAIGLCGILARGVVEGRPRAWLLNALAGSVAVTAASLHMLLIIPHVARHEEFQSDSLATTLEAAGKLVVAWMGVPLQVVYPWALIVLAIPVAYLLGRIVLDLWRLARKGRSAVAHLGDWADLTILFLGTVGVVLTIAYGRGNMSNLWDSRYATLAVPVGVVAYLLMVRLRAPRAIPGLLAMWMAVCVGWNWPDAIRIVKEWHGKAFQAEQALEQGQEPLSVLAPRLAPGLGYECGVDKLVTDFQQLRAAGLSVFRKNRNRDSIPGLGKAQAWEAETGQLTGACQLVGDSKASRYQVVEVGASPGGLTARYSVAVPGDGCYLLCLRLQTPAPGHTLTVRVDNEPALERALPDKADYYPYVLDPLLSLSAGNHFLTITLPKAGAKLDLLELVPRSRVPATLASTGKPG